MADFQIILITTINQPIRLHILYLLSWYCDILIVEMNILIVTGFEKSRLPGTISHYEIFRVTNFNYLKYYISRRKTDACLQFAMVLQLFTVYLYTPTVECIPTILQIAFTGIANTTSTPMGVEGGEGGGSQGEVQRLYINTEIS